MLYFLYVLYALHAIYVMSSMRAMYVSYVMYAMYVMHVLHIGCHAHQLAVDEVRLNFVDPRIEATLGCVLVEPVHLEWPRTQRRQCKPAKTFNGAHSVNFEATDDAGQRCGFGLHVRCLSRRQAEQIDVVGFGQFPYLVVSTQLIPLVKWPRKPRR